MVPPNSATDEIVIDDDLVQALGFEPATDDFFDADLDAGLSSDRLNNAAVETVIDLDSGTGSSSPTSTDLSPQATTLAPLAPPVPLVPTPLVAPAPGVPTSPPLVQVAGEQVVIPRRLAPDDAAIIDFRIESAKGRPKLKARKVRRVVRHIDPWSVLRFSVIFHVVLLGALLVASVLVWNAAELAGVVENIESLIAELASLDEFTIDESALFRVALVSAATLTLASSVLLVLLSVVFNLISDLTGGIRFTVIEEERVRTVRRAQAKAERVDSSTATAQDEGASTAAGPRISAP